mmetsp:Transcript_42296/g.67734  ORF Transcript_42296/g.67734 Transcript_42296/m.67734 type:complete len:534 (+) Transcript_42296:760-2361(+)
MLANNEVGTLQPIREIVERLTSMGAKRSILVHTDASQAVGKIEVDVNDLGVDMLTIAGHKLYGPKGIGALYLRASSQKQISKINHGANHELNRRAGTENVLLSTGLGVACELATMHIKEEMEHVAGLRDRLYDDIREQCERFGSFECHRNGHPEHVLPNTLSISFRKFYSSEILSRISPKISCSAGAACHTKDDSDDCCDIEAISSVLRAMDLSPEFAFGTLRLSVGRFTTPEDIKTAASVIIGALVAIRNNEVNRSSKDNTSFPATIRDYMQDTYKFQSKGTVLQVNVLEEKKKEAVEEGKENPGEEKKQEPKFTVVLDRTIFHPQGGGQPADIGSMKCPTSGAVFQVEFTEAKQDVVFHHGKFEDPAKSFGQGSVVDLEIDRANRELNARLHSAGHLIDHAMSLAGCNLIATKGYHFPSGPSVEYKGKISAEERASLKAAVEEHANQLVQQAIPTRVIDAKFEDAADLCIPGQAPIGDGNEGETVRIVLVGSVKGCPCGGTHVQNTKQIGGIKIRKVANKKGMLKISYELE